MARTRNAVKRQKVAAVESALFNPDVVFLLAGLLDARDLCQVSLTCKTLGGKQAAYSGLSLVEEAARQQLFEQSVTEREKSCLPKYEDEGWIELYFHLLMLRSKLTFDQLVGSDIQYGEDTDLSTVQGIPGRSGWASSLCSNHVMRSDRHFALFAITGRAMIGVIRPVQINEADFDNGYLDQFCPALGSFWEYLMGKRTGRWSDSNVHCCAVDDDGHYCWYDWTSDQPGRRIAGFQRDTPISLLLDLDEGTLTVYQNGERIETLNGLSGEYCWYGATIGAASTGLNVNRVWLGS